jgi:hypothetical protein
VSALRACLVLGVSIESALPTVMALSSSSFFGESCSGSAPLKRYLEHEMHVSFTMEGEAKQSRAS